MKRSNLVGCHLCGSTDKSLIKTFCCNNLICNDSNKSLPSFKFKGSCYDGHDGNTVCAYHSKKKHPGKWEDCDACKESLEALWFSSATNVYNFERLRVTVKCGICSFESNHVEDFQGMFSRMSENSKMYWRWYCCDEKCDKIVKKLTFNK